MLLPRFAFEAEEAGGVEYLFDLSGVAAGELFGEIGGGNGGDLGSEGVLDGFGLLGIQGDQPLQDFTQMLSA